MASVSAFVSMGPTHPNDIGFSPEWICELWEGDRAKWVLRSVRTTKRPKSFSPDAPAKIFESLKDAISTAYPGSLEKSDSPKGISIVIVCLEGSSLRKFLPRLRKLGSFDIHEAPVSWSRTYSGWSGDWTTSSKE
jgi:hypothetical protein